jgi:hypothetical protein
MDRQTCGKAKINLRTVSKLNKKYVAMIYSSVEPFFFRYSKASSVWIAEHMLKQNPFSCTLILNMADWIL